MLKKSKIKILEILVENEIISLETAIRKDVYEENLRKEIGLENKNDFYKILKDLEKGHAIIRAEHSPTGRVYIYLDSETHARIKRLLLEIGNLELTIGLIVSWNKGTKWLIDKLLKKIYHPAV